MQHYNMFQDIYKRRCTVNKVMFEDSGLLGCDTLSMGK
jgi:hypothetical protein